MRKRQQRFLSVNRIFSLLYVPITLALCINFFFSGWVVRAVLALCSLLWILVPWLMNRMFHAKPAQLLIFFYHMLFLLMYTGGPVLMLNRYVPVYNAAVHLISGFIFALLAQVLFCVLMCHAPCAADEPFCFAFCLFCALTLNGLWSLGYHLLLGGAFVPAGTALLHFFLCLTGVGTYIVLMWLDLHKNKPTFPLLAVKDFCHLNVRAASMDCVSDV